MKHLGFRFSGVILVLLAAGVTAKEGALHDGWPVEAGQRADLVVDVPLGDSDPATFIPVTVLRGTAPGPSLLMVSGVHGFEFAPILAAERVANEIDPARLSGTLIIVRLAHVPAFEHRAPYVNPFDRKNLNRSFPGSATGTQTERIAHLLSTRIIPGADMVLDVHSGDGAEWLDPFVGVYEGALASKPALALAVAEAMGFPNIVRYRMETREQVDQGRSLNRQAVAQGLPTLLVEIGENGRREPAHIDAIVTGIKRALVTLDMLSGETAAKPSASRLFTGTASVTVSHSGVWSPVLAGGRSVEKGELLGVVRDYAGDVVETVSAPVSGYALYGLAGPPVRSGESVVTIALPERPVE